MLADLRNLGNRETQVVIAVLAVADLAMAAYLPILAALVSGLGVLAATASLGLASAAVVVAFAVALRFPGVLHGWCSHPTPRCCCCACSGWRCSSPGWLRG